MALAQTAGGPQRPVGERPEDLLRNLDTGQNRIDKRLGPVPSVTVPRQPGAAAASAASVRFVVKRIAFSKSSVLPDDRLRKLAARVEGREVSLAEINQLVAQVTDLYQELKFPVGFAILPPQTVASGVVQVVLIEPRVDKLEIAGAAYTDPGYLRERVPLASGDLVDVYALERAMLVMRRTSASGIQLSARLIPGGEFGTSRVVIDVVEPPRHTLASTTDNFGQKSNGIVRNMTRYHNAALTGRDDPMMIGAAFSQGSRSNFGIYDVPVGIQGTRVEFRYSLSESEVIAGTFGQLGLRSSGQFVSAEVRHPFLVENGMMLHGLTEVAYSNGTTTTGPLDTGTAINRLGFGARWTRFDENSVLELTGKTVLVRAHHHDNIGDTTDNYVKFTGNVRATRRIGVFTAVGEFNGQVTPFDLLPSAEQFGIGGATTLRAFENNQFNGDQGYIARLELHGPRWFGKDLPALHPYGISAGAFVFAETGAALPHRANGDKVQRVDFASDFGAGIDFGMFGELLRARVMVAHSIDEVHEKVIQKDPKVLAEITLKFEF